MKRYIKRLLRESLIREEYGEDMTKLRNKLELLTKQLNKRLLKS